MFAAPDTDLVVKSTGAGGKIDVADSWLTTGLCTVVDTSHAQAEVAKFAFGLSLISNIKVLADILLAHAEVDKLTFTEL